MKRKLLLFVCFDLALLGAAVLLLYDDKPARPVVPEQPAQVAQQRRVTRVPQPEVVRPRKPAPVDPAAVEAEVEQRLQAAREESDWPVVKELNARLKQLRREREARERAAFAPGPEFIEPSDGTVWYGANGEVLYVAIPAPDPRSMPPTLEPRAETPTRFRILPKSDR